MPTIRFFIISCSADAMPEPLFIWGEGGHGSMPTSRDEAEIRVENCREKTRCANCDAQIHHLNLMRTHKPGVAYDDDQRKRGKV